MPPGESPGEKGQHGPLIVFEKGQKGRRNALYQNGQYVGLQSHMFTRLKLMHNQIYFFIHVYMCNIYHILYRCNFIYSIYNFIIYSQQTFVFWLIFILQEKFGRRFHIRLKE